MSENPGLDFLASQFAQLNRRLDTSDRKLDNIDRRLAHMERWDAVAAAIPPMP